jgi:hypothetical protein
MFTRQHLQRLLWIALPALIRGAAADLGTSLIGFIVWWFTNH